MKIKKMSVLFILLIEVLSCSKPGIQLQDTVANSTLSAASELAAAVTENFETGTKTSYTTANVTLSTGSWTLNDALIGNLTTDKKNGTQSARVRNSGVLKTNFDYTGGASTVTIAHALFGSDASSKWQLWYSINGGSTYTQSGVTVTTNNTLLQTATFTINLTGNIRFEIRKTDGSTNRINFDDFNVNPYTAPATVPTLASLSPASAQAAGPAFTLSATGTNFTTTSTINWNGVALATTYISATSLSASVPAANIATTGTASINVNTPGAGTSAIIAFAIKAPVSTTRRFLFDATKAETAGNADWVIDEDSNIPQRTPTPAQSGITSSTPETYWTGAISSWGIALVKAGNKVETLPSGGTITFGSTTNAQDLSHYDVFVVDEPNIRFTAAEKLAILNFVKNGGGLLMIADHNSSDRNNDGWDSPAIWNDMMTNNTLQNNPFGFSIDLTNVSGTSSNVLANSASNTILHGSKGAVSTLQFNNGATLTLQPSANSAVQGLIWQSGYTQSSTHVMCASSTYYSGRVFVVTDSSPMDDGTGGSGNSLYVSWPLYSHAALFMNVSLWLAKTQ